MYVGKDLKYPFKTLKCRDMESVQDIVYITSLKILQIVDKQLLISDRVSFDSLSEEYAKEEEVYRTKIQKVC